MEEHKFHFRKVSRRKSKKYYVNNQKRIINSWKHKSGLIPGKILGWLNASDMILKVSRNLITTVKCQK